MPSKKKKQKIDHSARSHAELPPSSSDKWIHCWDWLRTNAKHYEDFGRPGTSAAAAEGTAAHETFEKLVKGVHTISPKHAYPKTASGRGQYAAAQKEEHADTLGHCVDWVEEQPGVIYPETRVDFGAKHGYVGLEGTADITIVTPDKLQIADLKFGRILVEVADKDGNPNPQLMCYLLGAINKFGERDSYAITVLQPRAKHRDGPIRTKEISRTDLAIFEYDLFNAVEANYSHRHTATPGPWCRKFCDSLGSCGAVRKQALQLMRDTPIDED